MSSLMMAGILLGGAGATAVLLRRKIEEWIAFVAFLIAAALCGFAMADALALGYAVVKYAGLAALAFSVGAALWKREYRSLLLTPGALAFCAMMIIVWGRTPGAPVFRLGRLHPLGIGGQKCLSGGTPGPVDGKQHVALPRLPAVDHAFLLLLDQPERKL